MPDHETICVECDGAGGQASTGLDCPVCEGFGWLPTEDVSELDASWFLPPVAS